MLPIALVACLLTLALPALADITKEAGYIDLSFIDIPDDADEVQDIDLTSMLVTLADDARAEGETDLADLLAMVRSVRVKAFSVGSDDAAVKQSVDRVMKKLDQDKWTRIIYVKDDDETISVSTKTDKNGNIVGLTVVMFEPGDSVGFVNVVGDINLGKLLSLAGRFDMDDLDEYIEDYEADQKSE
jgi:hypothetical protein